MNAARRKQLDALISSLEDLRSQVEAVKDEEQEYLDNMPENMRDGDKGSEAQEAVDNLDAADAAAQDMLSALESAKGG